MTTDERQKLIDRLEEAEGCLDRADLHIAARSTYYAQTDVSAAVNEIRAVKRALEEAINDIVAEDEWVVRTRRSALNLGQAIDRIRTVKQALEGEPE